MKEVGRISFAGQRLWQEVLDTAINKPSPITAFDAFFHLALIVTLEARNKPSITTGNCVIR